MRTRIAMMLALMFAVTALLSFLWYRAATQTIERNAIETCTQMIEATSRHLDVYFDDVERLTVPMVSCDEAALFMKNSSLGPYPRFITSYRFENDIILPMMLKRPDFYGISLVSDKNVASSNVGFTTAQQRYPDYVEKIPDFGSFRVIGLEKVGYREVEVVSLAMRFRDSHIQALTGMLIVDLNVDRIRELCMDTQLGESGIVWIADRYGRVLYHPDRSLAGTAVSSEYGTRFAGNNSGNYRIDREGDRRLVVFVRSAKTGLFMVSEIRMDEQTESLARLSLWTLSTLMVLFLLLSLVTASVGYRFTRSVLQLKELMLRAESGDLTAAAPTGRHDEMGSLFKSFNSMVVKIRELIEDVHRSRDRERDLAVKQREAVLGAMQSQINPHFLYNTLEVINSYAILEGNDKVSKMIVSLSEIFRYSIGSPTSLVQLEEEVRHIRSYLQIQKERFEHLEFRIEADEADLRRCTGVRLMLQPLVENCFKHGYDKAKRRPGSIAILGGVHDGAYTVDVVDTGKGMDARTREELNRAFAGEVTDAAAASGSSSTIGLMNVHSRIRISFGAPYGLSIVRSDEDGTVVRITLPMDWNGTERKE
jgi:sensor histidine kinase YesM